jgi:carbamoyl-phosphate synthase large subunit
MNILITSAGQRVSLVNAFKHEFNKINMNVYTTDANPALAPACHLSDKFFFISKVTDENYISELLNLCLENNVKIIIPTIDTELNILSKNKHLFTKNGIEIVISSYDFISICRDKRETNKFFIKNDIDIPLQYDLNLYKLPVFTKPISGSLSKGILKIDSKIDFLNLYDSLKDINLFMEFIDPSLYDEYTVDAYYSKENALVSAVPRKRIFVRAGEINKGVTKKNVICQFMKNKLSFINGALGCITFQFFLNKISNEIKAIEINPRFGGGYPLSYKSGANFPLLIIKEYLRNEKLKYSEDWKSDLLMLRYDKEYFIENFLNE